MIARFLGRLALAAFAMAVLVAAQPKNEEAGSVELFNGKNLDGWVQQGGKAKYFVRDGELVGQSVPNSPNSFLCTTKNYGNFQLTLDFKVDPQLNSGVQVRSEFAEPGKTVKSAGKSITGKEGGRVFGYQVEIDPDPKRNRWWTGGIYDEGRRNWLKDLKENEPARKAFKQNEWNQFRIECQGDTITTWINGVKAAELKDNVTPTGFIALQVHGVGKETKPLEIRFRNIRLQELK